MELSEDEVEAWNALQDSRFTMFALEEENDGMMQSWPVEVKESRADIWVLRRFLKSILDLDERGDVEMQIELLQYTLSEAEQNINNNKAHTTKKVF